MKEYICFWATSWSLLWHIRTHRAKLHMDFPWREAAHVGRLQVKWNLHWPTGSPGLAGTRGCLRVAKEPWLSRPTRRLPLLPPAVPAHSSAAASIPFSLTVGWQWLTLSHEVSVMKSEVSRLGSTQRNPLAKRSMLKYRVRFRLSLVKPTITFELTGKWEDSWLLPSQ